MSAKSEYGNNHEVAMEGAALGGIVVQTADDVIVVCVCVYNIQYTLRRKMEMMKSNMTTVHILDSISFCPPPIPYE